MFNCYFIDLSEDQMEIIKRWIGYIPSAFDIVSRDEPVLLPDIVHFAPEDQMWNDFPFPAKENTLFVMKGDGMTSKAAGGGMANKAAAKAWNIELTTPIGRETVALRIWHELLHAVGQPADDMSMHNWLDGAGLCFALDKWYKRVDRNYWQRQYYLYLTREWIENGR